MDVVGEPLTITSPLTEESNKAVTCESVDGSSVLEERPVIPPSLVGAIELQMSLVLEHLKLNPLAIHVAVAVIFGQESPCLLLLAVAVKPLIR